jgi:hypothetical protein
MGRDEAASEASGLRSDIGRPLNDVSLNSNRAGVMKSSGGHLRLSLLVLAHYVAAPPDRLDVILATRCVGDEHEGICCVLQSPLP